MPTITGVSHVVLTVRSPQASARWYRELLGLQTAHEEGDAFVLLVHPGTGLLLGLRRDPGNDGSRFSEARTGLDHLSFLVPGKADLEEWRRHLEARGVPHSPVAHESYGSVLVFRDPDNIQLELFAR